MSKGAGKQKLFSSDLTRLQYHIDASVSCKYCGETINIAFDEVNWSKKVVCESCGERVLMEIDYDFCVRSYGLVKVDLNVEVTSFE